MTFEENCLEIAKLELGVHEVPGPVANKRIVEYAKHTSLKSTSDEVPWCSALANFVVDTAGGKGTNSAAARSWLDWGVPIPDPVPGCIAIIDRKDANNPFAAHVCFYVKDSNDGQTFVAIGGNQSDSVKYSAYSYAKVLGWRVKANG